MSYILDALRKSEQERRQLDTPVLTQVPVESIELPHSNAGRWIGIGLAALTVAGVLVFSLWGIRAPQSPTVVPPTETASVSPATPAATTASDSDGENTPASRPAPQLRAHPLIAAPESAPVRDLADEAQTATPPPKPTKAEMPEMRRTPVGVVSTAPESAEGGVKFLRAMPPDFQRSLPELTVNIHIYAPRAVDRILYINNRQYHAGDRVRDDIRVEEIVEDGAVLSFRGQRFKLPRPS